MKNWKRDLFDSSWYDLGKDDNLKIVELVKSNILSSGLDYFDSYSSAQKAIETTLNSGSYYYRCPLLFDLALIENNKKQAETILIWFDDFVSAENPTFDEYVWQNVDLRKKKQMEWI